MNSIKKLTYKQKLRALFILIGPVFLLCYKLAFTNTIGEYKRYRQYEKQRLLLSNPDNALSALNAKQQSIAAVLKNYELDTLNGNKNLITVVTEFCNENRLDFKEYKPLNVFQSEDMPILTRTITVEGDFIKCLQLVYSLENEYEVGRVSSVLYKTYEDPQTKTLRLSCILYIQNIVSS